MERKRGIEPNLGFSEKGVIFGSMESHQVN